MTMKQKRTIRNQSRTINLMISKNDIFERYQGEAWLVSPDQYRRIKIADDGTPWRNERAVRIFFSEVQ